MISVMECGRQAGLSSHELIIGPIPTARHEALLSSYLLSLRSGPTVVRNMIVSDLRGFLDLGVRQRAADLLIVLRLFLTRFELEEKAAPAKIGNNSYAPIMIRSARRNRVRAVRRRGPHRSDRSVCSL